MRMEGVASGSPRESFLTLPTLLAVDLGLRTGLTLFGRDGKLRGNGSRHFGNRAQLRRGVHGLFDAHLDILSLVIEGGGPIAEV